MQQRLVNRGVLILLLIGITLLFLALIKPFLQAVFIAALFAALFSPLYHKILSVIGERPGLASALTLLTIILFVMVPLSLLLGTVTSQALDIAETAVPWVRQQLATPGLITETLEGLPFYEHIEPYREQALSRLGDLAGLVSGWMVNALQSITFGTFNVLLSVMIVLYTLFFFLIDGDRLLFYMLYYLPLNDEDETKLLQRFTSVTRATLKGTAVIGFLQGALAGLALYFAGIPSSLFWAVAMMVLSVVPGVGTALIWIPAVIYLIVGGNLVEAVAVSVFCIVVVGTVDNLLRPKLVGNDTQLHELLIFFSTLGGLLMFGFMGFVIGPIIAALFVTLWELYGHEFKDWLPTTAFRPRRGAIEFPHETLERMGGQKPRQQEAAAEAELAADEGTDRGAAVQRNAVSLTGEPLTIDLSDDGHAAEPVDKSVDKHSATPAEPSATPMAEPLAESRTDPPVASSRRRRRRRRRS
ncbi:AI-2E family transporter [Granulosicoccus sp. 3-233]|uniref:AI-2E family transporter n=1 Tax=Granulosicoccus sp. 3-233 TaxID=3417969 RepID=UPI003D34387C